MLEEIVVAVDDRPGILAEMGELLGRQEVNIATLAASTINGQGIVHLVVDDGDDAAAILKENGFDVQGSREVISTTIDDRPGEFGRYCRRLEAAGVTIHAAYVARRDAGETEFILAVDDLETARTA